MTPPTLESHFSPLTHVVRRRLLPVPGQVLVHVGDWVRPADTIAVAPRPGELLVLDIAEELDCNLLAAERAIGVQVGQAVEQGAVLASHRSLLGAARSVTAPAAGVVQAINGGQLFLRQADGVQQLQAYIPGVVTEIFPRLGATIETQGALVRGIWGSGGSADGALVTMVAHASKELTWEQIGLRYRGAIVVGGRLSDPRVLFRARQFQLHGLVIGSIEPQLRPLCAETPLPIVVTEGIGSLPMAEPVFNLLRACHGRPAVLCGAETPEVIVPFPAAVAGAASTQRELSIGTRVRLTRAPFLGLLGEVVATADGPQETAIGTRAEGVHVRLSDGRKLFVPLTNLEPLE